MRARLSLAEVARQLGLSEGIARKRVEQHQWLSQPKGAPPTYHPQFPARYRAMRGLHHLTIEPKHRDWLARYQGEHLMTQPARRRRVGVDVAGVPDALDPASQINPGAEGLDDEGSPEAELLVFPGELLTQSTTLAVVLPGDHKESYFGARHVAIVQEGEDQIEAILRGVAVVNTAVEANIQDNLDRWNPPKEDGAPPAE